MREIRTWSQLSHHNVLPLLGIMYNYGDNPALVSPWQENGDAVHFLKDKAVDCAFNVVSFSSMNKLLWLNDRQILGAAAGLSYLHRNNVIHGDFRGVIMSISISYLYSNQLISRTTFSYRSRRPLWYQTLDCL